VNLVYATPNSYGIEIDERRVDFCLGLGLTVYQRDFVEDDVADLPQVEVVWCSAVLEHVDAPHIFLRNIHSILAPGGLVAIYVPTIPWTRWMCPHQWPLLSRYFVGHLASDPVNAFVPETLAFFCEGAGFETLEVSTFFPGPLRIFSNWPVLPRMIDGTIYVGRAILG
jgi:SAM-dependent methyltransferase